MSVHANLSPEAAARLNAQRRQATISSLVIALLSISLIGLILAFILLPALEKTSNTIVSYSGNPGTEDRIEPKKTKTSFDRRPSSPSQSSARVIAALTPSPISVPVPEIDATLPSMDFGDGNDFGDGGMGSGGNGGGGGGGATFFKQEAKAERIAFVIDYSLSMKGKREELMRDELARSVSKLPPGIQYQTIFFAGPTWLNGNHVQMSADNRAATVSTGKLSYRWILENSTWSPKGRAQPIDWNTSDPEQIEKSLQFIRTSKLNWGTEWEPALETAFRLRPAPQVIFFMTDGVAGGDLEKITRRIANRAKTQQTRINTVAMMEPNAHGPMKYLARETGGLFTIIDASGTVREVPLDDE